MKAHRAAITDRPSKPLVFIGSSERDLRDLPHDPKRVAGYVLRIAQQGGKHPDAKPLKGYGGATVLELTIDFRTDTYRVVYTVYCPDVLFMLHAFQKKSRSGRATAKHDLDLIRSRYQQAASLCRNPTAGLALLIAQYRRKLETSATRDLQRTRSTRP